MGHIALGSHPPPAPMPEAKHGTARTDKSGDACACDGPGHWHIARWVGAEWPTTRLVEEQRAALCRSFFFVPHSSSASRRTAGADMARVREVLIELQARAARAKQTVQR